MKAYHIISKNGNVKENIEPIFLSKENAEKRVKDLTSAIEYDHNNKTKYYIEETELANDTYNRFNVDSDFIKEVTKDPDKVEVDWEEFTERMRDKDGWLDIGRGLKVDREGHIAGGLKIK